MSLFHLQSWRIFSFDTEFGADSYFLATHVTNVSLSSGFHGFRWEIHWHLNHYFSRGNKSFYLAGFKSFFVFGFHHLDNHVCECRLLWVYPLRAFFSKLSNLQVHFSHHFFFFPFFFFFFALDSFLLLEL